jgi:hypothetical protein
MFMSKIYFIAAALVLSLNFSAFAQSDAPAVPPLNAQEDAILNAIPENADLLNEEAVNDETLNDEGYGADDIEYYGAEDNVNAEGNAEDAVDADLNAEDNAEVAQ